MSEQLTIGGTDLYIHKYLGPANTGPSTDFTQPQYIDPDPTKIQDLLFLETRDRKYEDTIYRLRGHYLVQNMDFDLSQFGLFINNDTIFINVHYNDMIDILGRKLMVGDVIELPHLLDYNPLDETIPVALKRYYQITDANYSSEGFSQTWYPHMWRIKCEQLVNSEEFSDILDQPINQDNYMGDYDSTKTYPPGYTVTYGDKIYEAKIPVPIGTTPPNDTYWELVENGSLSDIIATYNKNISVNDAVLREAERLVPKSGYDTSTLYVVPTYGEYESNGVLSHKINQPANPINVSINLNNTTAAPPASVVFVYDPNYENPAVGIRLTNEALEKIWEVTTGLDTVLDKLDRYITAQLSIIEEAAETTDSGSGSVETNKILLVQSLGAITGPYGTSDNTYATSDQDPEQPGFTGDITTNMDYRADCIPGYQFIARATPRSFGYAAGYLTGNGTAPNGFPTGAGISFPQNPQVGDYYLRIDYFPQVLFRWNGKLWLRISENVRTEYGLQNSTDQSLLSGFINNTNEIYINNTDQLEPEAQPLSSLLMPKPDILPPET